MSLRHWRGALLSCKAILPEIENAEAALTGSEVRGLLRIDVYGPMARTFILPKLPIFL